ncbi:MAG TPA: hypothetical protein VIL74_25255 [Pyrinomonadaceae bacterium]|jgi:hypothetical protein
MKFYKTFSAAAIALTIFAATAFAQRQIVSPDDAVLVAGNPALRQSDVLVQIEFYEWLLARKFTAAQRRQFQTLIVNQARAKASMRATIAETNEGFRKIQAAGEEESRRVREEFLPPVLAELETNQRDPLNRFLFAVYRGAPDGETTEKIPAAPADDRGVTTGAVKLADLAGLWSNGSVSGERYRSLITGELSEPSGSIIEYEISPNGQVKYASYYSNTMYGCTTKLFVYKSGRLSVDGATLSFDYAPGRRTQMVCTAKEREATIPAERKTVAFRLERDQYGLKLCTKDDDGADFCLRKVEE